MMNASKKNILIICPVFHGYEKRIITCIKQSGNYSRLFFIKDTPILSEKCYLTLKNFIPILGVFLEKVFNRRIRKFVRNKRIGTLFIVKGKYVSREVISIIKKEYPQIRMVLYEWDSVFSNPNALSLLNEIRESYTFDFDDAYKYKRFKYLPLFYSFDQLPKQEKRIKDIDFLFVAGFSLERMPMFLKIKEMCEIEGWNFTFYLYVPYSVYVKHKDTMHPYKDLLSFKSLDFENYFSLICRARAVVDIVSTDQTGLTIRTIEALSQECHLITTNSRIAEMDFYTDSNITIVDTENLEKEILKNALEKRFNVDYNKSVYSTKEWLEKMAII